MPASVFYQKYQAPAEMALWVRHAPAITSACAVSKGTLELLFIGNTAERVLDDLSCDDEPPGSACSARWLLLLLMT